MRHRQGVREDRSMTNNKKRQPTIWSFGRIGVAVLCILYCLIPLHASEKPPVHRTHRVSPVAPIIKNASFHSAALGRDMPYRIYLPHNYAATTRRYPVLYLLHGLYGSYENWDTLTNLANYVACMDLIIVIPEADNSWYTNSATAPQDKFEDYIAKDLISEIDAKYRTIRDRHARAIAGLSMGGYGALKIALRDPHNFAFAGSLSGAIDAGRDLDSRVEAFAPRLLEVFGAAANPVRQNNDLFPLLQNAARSDLPYLYLGCGIDDEYFLFVNREFVAQLSHRHVAYEYHETPGKHDWAYWDRAIQPMLSTMESMFHEGLH
jgi:putative tributyrin esterase